MLAARPPLALVALFFAAYLAAAGFAKWLAIIPGTGISIWPPAGVYLATLALTRRASWPWWISAGLLAELAGNALWFRNPLPVAVLLHAGNALCALLGAGLAKRAGRDPFRLETLRDVLVLALGAIVAPLASATVGASTLAWAEGQPFAKAWSLWWVGDATGVLVVAPLILVIAQSWRDRARLATHRLVEAGLLGLVVLGVAALSLGGYLPFAYIVLPALLWAAIRFEFKGAVLTLVLLAIMAALFTVDGASPFAGDDDAQRQRHVMLQLFLAISALTALVVAAISRQHKQALRHLIAAKDDLERRVAERTADLARSEQRFRTLADSVPIVIWVTDAGGGIEFVNRQYEKYFGVREADVRASGWRPLIHPDDEPAYTGALSDALATRGEFAATARARRADGRWRVIASRGVPRLSDAGTFLGIVGNSLDVTDQRAAEERLRESEAHYRSMFEVSAVGMAQADVATRRFVRVNAALCALTGYTREELLAATVDALNHPEDRERDGEVFGHLVAGRLSEYSIEKRYIRKDGSTLWVQVTGNVVRDEHGRPVRAFAIVQDIGARKRSEEALTAAARAKDEFLAMLAHELRNPLAPIRNAASLVQAAGPQDAAVASAGAMIERQVAHMARLVDDLLDVARVSRGTITLQPVPLDVRQVVQQVIETHRAFVDARRHRLALALPDAPVWVHGDVTRLAQAIGNLVDNAAKYTAPGGRIGVALACEDGQAVVRVRDSGRGIAPEAIGRLFEMFYQAESTLDRREGGLGIGLALVKRLVELHGGSVQARSAGRGQGSEFSIRLPLLRAASEARVVPGASTATPQRRRVLVVDDNRDAADSTALLLECDGHEVHVAYDGREAVEVALRERPAAVLLDLGLPSLDGYQACRAMREAGLADTLIVALTGYGQEEDQRSTLAAGFDAHQVKPVELATLRALLARAPREDGKRAH